MLPTAMDPMEAEADVASLTSVHSVKPTPDTIASTSTPTVPHRANAKAVAQSSLRG